MQAEFGAPTSETRARKKVSNAISNAIWGPINNPINNPTNNPKYKLKAKEVKERLLFGCTFAEFFVLSLPPEEQQRKSEGFKELDALTLAVNDARSAEEEEV